MLTDEASLQKARSKFLQAYEGNMMVRGEGDDVWYQRLWRTLEPEYFDIITQRRNATCYRYTNLISPECCIKIAQYEVFIYDAPLITD